MSEYSKYMFFLQVFQYICCVDCEVYSQSYVGNKFAKKFTKKKNHKKNTNKLMNTKYCSMLTKKIILIVLISSFLCSCSQQPKCNDEEVQILVVKLIKENVLSSKLAKEVIKEMTATGKSPSQIVEEKGLKQISDEGQIRSMIEEVLRENSKEVERFKAGEEKVFGFLVGQVMKKAKGKANPQLVNKLLREMLSK